VIGDWGFDWGTHGNIANSNCQQNIADQMLEKMNELGDVKFIINVGDSFYPKGVSSKKDAQWDAKWRNMFAPELRSVPWYSTYGNHDYQSDPCACAKTPSACAQVNDNISDLSFFYMPDTSWFKEHPELGLEVVSLDMNQLMDAWNHKAELVPSDCRHTPCKAECEGNLKTRTKQSIDLLHQRALKSRANNLLVFSHYPTDYLWSVPDVMADLRGSVAADGGPRHVEYFGGHRHNVDQWSTTSIYPNSNWLVGGGGGWSCEGSTQGFVVGEIGQAFDVKTYSVLVDVGICCGNMKFQ
jgi:hypothetical protein